MFFFKLDQLFLEKFDPLGEKVFLLGDAFLILRVSPYVVFKAQDPFEKVALPTGNYRKSQMLFSFVNSANNMEQSP